MSRIRVMVTISVKRGDSAWTPGRVLTLGSLEGGVGVQELWMAEFPRHLDRALRATPDEEVEEPDDE